MCLAIPARLIEVQGEQGTVELGGTRKTVMLSLVDSPQPGQYVLLHAGYAIEVISEADARELAQLHRLVAEAGEDE